MNEQELNRRRAAWAGFSFMDEDYCVFKPHPTYECIEIYGARWITPDGTGALADLPDFPNDLTACFEWLVPKLLMVERKYYTYKLLKRWLRECIEVDGDVPPITALALCKAIDKLIDDTEQGGN